MPQHRQAQKKTNTTFLPQFHSSMASPEVEKKKKERENLIHSIEKKPVLELSLGSPKLDLVG